MGYGRSTFSIIGCLAATLGLVAPTATALEPATTSDVVGNYGGLVDSPTAVRLGGQTRYETAVSAAKQFAPGIDTVYVASGQDFPDAISASAAAGTREAPLLLTKKDSLPQNVSAELRRLSPKKIVIVGGTGVISSRVQTDLRRVAPTERVSGSNRYLTSTRLAKTQYPGGATHAIIATGRDFPDALAASPAAALMESPVLLVDGIRPSASAETISTLKTLGVNSVGIVGGASVVSAGIERQIRGLGMTVTRHSGSTRFGTAAAINNAYFNGVSSDYQVLAVGRDFPDALAGAALAGARGGPLVLSERTCIPPAVDDSVSNVGASTQFVMGGLAVLAPSAAVSGRCQEPTKSSTLKAWAMDDWNFQTDVVAPYDDRPPVNVYDPSIRLDASGVKIFILPATGKRVNHPVSLAQYGISALVEFDRTGNETWKKRAIAQANSLLSFKNTRDGAYWFPYNWNWTYYANTLKSPWYSAMAQGQALSLFTRLYVETGEDKWQDAANKTWASFSQPYASGKPWSSLVIDSHLYLEEYAGNTPPLLVMNGHMFSAFGLYDYWKLTGDELVLEYLNGALTTVQERMLPMARMPGEMSYYCVRAAFCQHSRWQTPTKYQEIHAWQLDTWARLTGDDRLTRWAALLRQDWSPGKLRSSVSEDAAEWGFDMLDEGAVVPEGLGTPSWIVPSDVGGFEGGNKDVPTDSSSETGDPSMMTSQSQDEERVPSVSSHAENQEASNETK